MNISPTSVCASGSSIVEPDTLLADFGSNVAWADTLAVPSRSVKSGRLTAEKHKRKIVGAS